LSLEEEDCNTFYINKEAFDKGRERERETRVDGFLT
jgi:hypothetical protein